MLMFYIIELYYIVCFSMTNKSMRTFYVNKNSVCLSVTLLEHYAHDIMYKLYSDDSYETTPMKGAVERPSFRLSNLEHNSNYVFNVRPYRLLNGTKELGTPSRHHIQNRLRRSVSLQHTILQTSFVDYYRSTIK